MDPTIVDAARRGGFGRPVRVRRQVTPMRGEDLLVLIAVFLLGTAAIPTYGLSWRVVALWWAGFVLGGLVWRYVHGRRSGRWIVNTDNGSFLWSPGRKPERLFGERARSPIARWTAWIVGVLAVPLFAWFVVVPVARDVMRGERPGDVDELGRICSGDDPFPGLPPYAGPAPHPAVVFRKGSADFESHPDSPPTAVQLVGCARLARADPSGGAKCEYDLGGKLTMHRGQYSVQVREARTGRHVTALTVVGEMPTCPDTAVPPRNGLSGSEMTQPDRGGYLQGLVALIHGPVE